MLRKLFFLTITVACLSSGYTQTKVDSLKTVLSETTDKEKQLLVLDELTKQLVQNKSDEQEKYLQDYMKLSKDLEMYDEMVSKSRFLIQYYIYNGKIDNAQKICDSLLLFKNKFKKANSEAHLLLKRGAIFFAKEEFVKADSDYTKAHKLFIKSGDSIFAADALYFNAQVSTDMNVFVDAVKHYEGSSKLYELLGDNQYALMAGAELVSLYNINGFTEKALKESERLIKKAKENNDNNSIALLIGQRISSYNKLKKYDKIRELLDELSKIKNEDFRESWKGYFKVYKLVNELQYAININDLNKAKIYFEQLNDFIKDRDVPSYVETDVLNVKAEYYGLIGDMEKQLPILNKLVLGGAKTNIDVELKSRQKLAEIYNNKGQVKDALKLYRTNIKIKDSIYTSQKTNAFLYYQAEYETERRLRELTEQDAEIEKLELDKELANSKRNTLMAIIIILLLLAFAVWWYGKTRRKQLADQLEQNKKELNRFTQQLLERSNETAQLQEQFNKVKEELTTQNTINDFQELLSAKILTSDDWYDFKEKFLKVHPRFFKKILDKGYKLTKSEERLVALEKLGLDNNEIANMLGISVDSIFNNRYRLRKKINASNEISLLEFFEKAS